MAVSFENLPKGKEYVSIQLSNGKDVVIELYRDVAPKTVESFKNLIQKGFYDGLTWHRVVPNFVVQGGCPEGTGMGGPGYKLPAEFNSKKHVLGTLAMARAQDPNSAGSQFYIVIGPASHLDNQYTVFGQVLEGMDSVLKIRQGDKMVKLTYSDQRA